MRDYKSKTRASYVACVGKAGADTYYDKFTSPNCPNSKLIKKHNLAVWHSGGGFFHLAKICFDEKIYLINPIEQEPDVDCTWLNDMTDQDIKKFNEDSLCQFGHEDRNGKYEYFILPFEEGLKRMENEIFKHAVYESIASFWETFRSHYPDIKTGDRSIVGECRFDEECEIATREWLEYNN